MAIDIGPRIGIDGEAEYRKQINEITQAQKALAAEMKATESAFDKNASAQSKNAAKGKNLQKQVENQKKKVDELKKGLNEASKKWGEDSQQVSKWRQAVANAETELNRLNAELAKTTPSVGERLQQAGNKISNIGDGMKSVGDTMTKYVSAPVMAVGAYAIKTAADFENAMAKVSTIADTTSVPIGDLEESILNLSDETGIAATDIAEAVYNAISAGQDTADAVGFVETATKLAKAGFTDTASSLDVLTSIMNAYGLESDKVTDVSDKLITVQNRGKTTIAQLSSSMGKVIPTASAFGVDLDNIASAYVVLTKNGISTAESTTYLNSMINELGKSGTKASKALKSKTGKSFKELMDDGGDLSSVLKVLQDVAEESGVSLADMFGSAEAGKAALSILSDGGEEFNASMAAMQEAAGATSKAFDTVSGTSSAKMQKSLNQLKNVAIKAGKDLLSMVAPGIEAVGKKIGELSQWYNSLDADTQRMVSNVGVALGVGGPLLSGVGSMVSGIGDGISTIGSLLSSTGIGAISATNPVILAAEATLAALAAAMIFAPSIEEIEGTSEFYKEMDKMQKRIDEINEMSESIGKSVSGSMEGVEIDTNPVENLYSKLEDCFDESGNLRGDMKDTAAYLVGEFNRKMGTDFSTTFGENAEKNIKQLGEMKKAMEDYVETVKRSAVQQAYNEQWVKASTNHANALVEEASAEKEYNKQLSAYNTLAQEYAAKNAEYRQEYEQWGSSNPRLTGLLNEASALKEQMEIQGKVVDRASEEWINAGVAAEVAGTQVQTMDDALSAIASGDTKKGVELMSTLEVNSAKAGEVLRKKLAPAFKYTSKQMRDFTNKAYLEDIKAPKLTAPNVAPVGKEVNKNLTNFFAKNSPTLSLRNSKIVGATEKGKETNTIIERAVSNITGRVGGINNASGAAYTAYGTMQSIIGRSMTGTVGSVSVVWSALSSAWSSMQSWFNSNPLTSYVQEVVTEVRSNGYSWDALWGRSGKTANGMIVNGTQIRMVGEAGPEAIIPLSASRRGRAMELYREVGNFLGSNTTNNTSNNININVYSQPGQSADDIAEIVSRKINQSVRRRGAVFA